MPLNENFSGYFIGGVADMAGPFFFERASNIDNLDASVHYLKHAANWWLSMDPLVQNMAGNFRLMPCEILWDLETWPFQATNLSSFSKEYLSFR